ncbi:hypothetical protein BDV12DRAFT_176933 [Aspergillus spectabilis]
MSTQQEMPPRLRPALNYRMRPTRRYITGHDSTGAHLLLASPDLLYLDRGGYAISRTYALNEVPTQLGDDQEVEAYLSSNDQETLPRSPWKPAGGSKRRELFTRRLWPVSSYPSAPNFVC